MGASPLASWDVASPGVPATATGGEYAGSPRAFAGTTASGIAIFAPKDSVQSGLRVCVPSSSDWAPSLLTLTLSASSDAPTSAIAAHSYGDALYSPLIEGAIVRLTAGEQTLSFDLSRTAKVWRMSNTTEFHDICFGLFAYDADGSLAIAPGATWALTSAVIEASPYAAPAPITAIRPGLVSTAAPGLRGSVARRAEAAVPAARSLLAVTQPAWLQSGMRDSYLDNAYGITLNMPWAATRAGEWRYTCAWLRWDNGPG